MIPTLTLEQVSVPPGRITWIYLLMSGDGKHYAHTLVSTPDTSQSTGVLTGFGRGEMAYPRGKTVFFFNYKTYDLEYCVTMYADSELIERHWEDFRRMLRNARRYESRRAAADPKPRAAEPLSVLRMAA
jgi:hypothetical protein